MIAAEYEAIQLYEQLADSTDNKLARKVLLDISGEEKEHVGEFRHLLSLLAPEDEADYCEGMGEAREYLAPLLQPTEETNPPCADKCFCQEQKSSDDSSCGGSPCGCP